MEYKIEQENITKLESIIRKDYSNIAGMVVLKDGKTVYENYLNGCTADSRFHLFSVTKSIMSILIGIAIDKGHIKSVHQKLADFFPEHAAKNQNLHQITLKNLLTMTVPYKYVFPPYKKYFMSQDWVKFSLDLAGRGGQCDKFRYAPLIGPDILSGILIKVTGQSVLDFATENLFAPLGIAVAGNIVFHSKEEQLAFNQSTNISGWAADPQGVNAAAWGLTLSPVDMAKIGQLYLNGGVWYGNPIVSEKWITESTSEQVLWKQRNQPYGYLWWPAGGKEKGYAAMGDGDNIIYVSPEKNLVVSIASLFIPRPKDRITLIKEYVEPIFA